MDDATDKKIGTDEIPLLQDRTTLLALYSEYNQNSRFIVDKIWTNARFFTTITSAMLTVTVAALVKVVLDGAAEPQAPKALLSIAAPDYRHYPFVDWDKELAPRVRAIS